MGDRSRRWAWLGVLVAGLVCYLIVLRTLVRTQNPNFVPALILLGATVMPLAFLTFAQGRTGRWQVPASALVVAAFFGGVIGTVVAGTLEYDTLRGLGALPMLLVALIEETAKMIVPVLLLFAVLARHRRRLPSDGLVIGVAAGMGFAALETMGYAFSALLSSQGQISAVEQTLFVRGLTAPAGHTAWTGLTVGALWALLAAPSARRALEFAGTFIGAVVLHTLWDTFSGLVVFAILAVISLGWLFWALHRYRAFADRNAPEPLPE
jgi:protease PrsW